MVETWDDGTHTAIYLPLMLAVLEYEANGEQVTWQDALACRLVETAQELRDRGDEQLTPEDFRTWAHLCTLLRPHDAPAPPAADPEFRRHHLSAGWSLERWSTGRADLTWHSPRWPDQEGATQATLSLSPAEAHHLAALLEGRVT